MHNRYFPNCYFENVFYGGGGANRDLNSYKNINIYKYRNNYKKYI